jgi:hypothetical protein
MKMEIFRARPRFFFAPEHGGDAISGGGHPADSSVPLTEAIDDAFAQDARGRGNTPGVGVPGSKTNPVGPTEDEIAQQAHRLWEEEGQPEGKAAEHWERAERTLREGRE